jgi:hypothetical protein
MAMWHAFACTRGLREGGREREREREIERESFIKNYP